MTHFIFQRLWRGSNRHRRGLTILQVVLALGVFFLWGGLGQVRATEEGDPCLRCHQAAWEADLGRIYVHAPFMEKKCGPCHGAASLAAPQAIAQARTPSAIEWFRRNRIPARDHWFAFAPSLVSDHLWIDMAAANERQNPLYVSLPPLSNLPELVNDGRPPQISQIEIQEVSLGVFVSAHISWETDKFADSSLLFGVGKLTDESMRDFYLRQKHEVILSGLEKGKEYLFSVVSEDAFGNRAVSAPLTFSTHRNLFPGGNPPGLFVSGSTDPSMSYQLQRAGEQYLLQLSASHPVTVSLGADAGGRNEQSRLAQVPTALADHSHPPLQDAEILNIRVCFECHQDINEAMSHPVNILPPDGMIIPPEYPLLADGRMTCMSCHRRHGSDLPFRMIKSSRKELCIGCHVNY